VVRELALRNFSWVVDGRLAGVARPSNDEALTALSMLGITALITLTEERIPEEMLTRNGLQAYHWPVADYTAPTLVQTEQIVLIIQDLLRAGQTVAVHCAVGLGRTGTILASYLVAEGMTATEAVSTIRRQRPGSIETTKQEEMVSLYEQLIRGSQA